MKPFLSKKIVLAVFLIAAQVLAACAPSMLVPIQAPSYSHTDEESAHAPSNSDISVSEQTAPKDKIDPLVFYQSIRKLWEDHVTWTRVFIIASIADIPEADAAAQRLLQNQEHIGDAIKPFYGDKAGEQLTVLLNDHILIAADLLAAAKSGDSANFNQANERWYDNANQIAAFLHRANPKHWPLKEMKSMMKSHLDLTLEEASARLNEDWEGDITAYDKVHDEILHMADMLSDGIVQQFPNQFDHKKISQQRVDLTLAMDKLWEDHVTWTRVFIISVTSDLPDADLAAQRLLQNQVDIGNAIKPIYGDEAGEQLTSLLNDHILIAAELLSAAKAGDNDKFKDANARWYENADQIGAFLHSANPKNWSEDEMQAMMKAHLDKTLEEAVARLNGDWDADVAAYDQIHDDILHMAGMLTEGIIAQFPKDFK
jgi:hypothetical protein